MRLYETTLVIDSLLKSDDIERVVRDLKEFISNNGGEIARVEEWGKRRLAYEIEKKQYGYYVYVRFQAPPNLPKLLEREFRLNDNILRYLTVLVDPKLLLKEEKQRSRREEIAAAESTSSNTTGESDESKKDNDSDEGETEENEETSTERRQGTPAEEEKEDRERSEDTEEKPVTESQHTS